MRFESLNERLRFLACYILAAQLLHEVRVLGEDATLQSVTLLGGHRRDVERVGRRLVRGLLQLAPIDQLDVGHGRPRRLPSILVLEPAPKSSENSGEIIVERRSRALVPAGNGQSGTPTLAGVAPPGADRGLDSKEWRESPGRRGGEWMLETPHQNLKPRQAPQSRLVCPTHTCPPPLRNHLSHVTRNAQCLLQLSQRGLWA